MISEKYRQKLIAQQGKIAEEELEPEERTCRVSRRKDNRDEASSSRDVTVDQLMKCMKDMQKEISLLPGKCAEVTSEVYFNLHEFTYSYCSHVDNVIDVSLQIVLQKLLKKGLVSKSNMGFRDEVEFVENTEEWVDKYGPSKYWTDVKSTPAKEDMDNGLEASFTTGKEKKLRSDKGVHLNTPGTGDEGDPFVIEENGNSTDPSLATVDTDEFPALTATPKNINTVSDGSSADKSEEISMDSLKTLIKKAQVKGTKDNDGKRKRKQSKYYRSPYQQNGGRKRRRKSKC